MPVVEDFMSEVYNPETLLRHFHVTVRGGAAGPSPPNGQAAVRRFTVEDAGFTAAGFTTGLSGKLGKTKARRAVWVTIVGGVPAGAPAANQFNAYYIPMVQTTDLANNASHYTLPTHGIPEIVITSQLTACTFGIGSDAMGATLVTHMQPNRNIAPNTGQAGVNQRLSNLAVTVNHSFPTMKNKFAFNRDYSNAATVMGKLTNGNWKFYMQAYRRHGEGSGAAITRLAVV